MPNFHLHIVRQEEVITDIEGSLYIDLATARSEARSSVCAIAASDLEKGRRIGIRRVDIATPEGEVVEVVTLAEVIAAVIPFDDDDFFADVARHMV